VIYILFLYPFLGLGKLYIKISSIHKKKRLTYIISQSFYSYTLI